MERKSLLNLLLLVAFASVLGGYFWFLSLPEPEPVIAAPIVTPAAPRWILAVGKGSSMEPWLPDGASYRIYLEDVPEIGDIVAFDCLSSKCIFEKNYSYTKFLRKIDSRGCYWFEGRTDEFYYNGVLSHSFDSTEYGYLCPGEFKILGVVRDLPSQEGSR